MAHGRARLTPFGRLVLVQRVLAEGWTVPRAAEAARVSRATVYKWLCRYRELGLAGLEDASSRPRRSPRRTPEAVAERILELRRRRRRGPHRLAGELGLPASTVYAVLRRNGVSRLRDLDRISGVRIRYVREQPGELLHLDFKKLGKIRPGGGHRLLGREAAPNRHRGLGYEYVHVAVDDCSRVAYAKVCEDDSGRTAARFLLEAAGFFADQGVHVERVMTDRGFCYTNSREFAVALDEIEARHKLIRKHHPQTTGKAERFIKTLLDEWAYDRLYESNEERRDALLPWLSTYNWSRPHTELRNQPPITVLVNKVCEKHT
jgi:transposase InsO family protein